jgi:hypothetical protein
MKKYIVYIPLVGMLLGVFASCTNESLEIKPDDWIEENALIDSTYKAQEYLNASYQALGNGGFLGGLAQLTSELMADFTYEAELSGDRLAVNNHTTDIFLDHTRELIYRGYVVVARANKLIDNIGSVADMDDATRTRMVAEAKFLRAIGHFEEVRFFAQPYGYTADNSHLGLPIRTTFSIAAQDRATVGEVYTQVINDLKDAINGLPTSNGNYANTWAAKGYLAKVYFQMNDFANAYSYADDVITNGGYMLGDSAKLRFSPTGAPENVFQLVSTPNFVDPGAALAGYYFINPSTLSADVKVSQNFYNEVGLSVDDTRNFYEKKGEAYLFKKFVATNAENMNVPLVHLTELKLIRAESGAELNDPAKILVARQDLSDIRLRAKLTPFADAAPQAAIIIEARTQRTIEMAGEGNRVHELKRRAILEKNRTGSSGLLINGSPWDCNGLILQIPDAELQANPGMQANPTGGC